VKNNLKKKVTRQTVKSSTSFDPIHHKEGRRRKRDKNLPALVEGQAMRRNQKAIIMTDDDGFMTMRCLSSTLWKCLLAGLLLF
jgi:hypothetical protein